MNPYPELPNCALEKTLVIVSMEPTEVTEQATADYIIHEVQSFVPEFNADSTMNKGITKAQFEYPITG